MKKKFLKVATALTIMGGVAFSAEGATAKAELAAKPQQASQAILKMYQQDIGLMKQFKL